MKKTILIAFILALGMIWVVSHSKQDLTSKQEPTNTGKHKMADSGAVYWTGQDGNTYLKSAATGWNGTMIGPGDVKNVASFATQIADPLAPPPPTSTNSGGTTSGGGATGTDYYSQYGGQTAYNQNIAQYDQGIGQVNSSLGNLGGQQQSANSKIDASYQDALNQLLGGENQAHATYDTNKHQTALDYVSGKNTVRANAGSSLNGLLRLLGSRGAGGGSAGTISAPGAVARQATLQQSGLGNTFGQNNQALDTNWGNYEIGVNNQRSSAAKQREEQFAQNNDQFNSQHASLLQQLAQLTGQKAAYTGGNAAAAAQPYLDQANALASTVGKFNYSPINYNTQAYTAPTLAQYTTAPNAAPKFNGQTQANDYTSPYLQALLGKKQQPAVA